ncbi:DMT family transporter [Marispirochaeta aestuarii]|uniref:DMT family transporter n=1 Tax=Marispirochaeta aestuarii TaxID=1963862 RepID=UPI002ABD2BA8|nr:DMT family transporter [Marispirochaeta aestuarii]
MEMSTLFLGSLTEVEKNDAEDAIGLLLVLLWLALRSRDSGLANYRLWFWSSFAGLGVSGNFAFYFVRIAQGSVAVAATLMYSAPGFVYLASFALKLERPNAVKWTSIAVVMTGIVLLTQICDVNESRVTVAGIGPGLLAGISYAVFIFGFKYAPPHGSPQAILSIAFAVLAAILLWMGDADQTIAALSTQDWPLFISLGVLGAGLSFGLYIIGLNYTAPAVASIMAMVEPVTASLFGVVVLREHLTGSEIVGMGLILVTVTALSIYSRYHRSFYD